MLKLKNDKERNAFLDNRREEDGWYIWIRNDDTDTRYWRYDLPEAALICYEEQRTYDYPNKHVTWTARNWYVVKDWSHRPFGDNVASKTIALKELKEEMKLQP